MKKVFEKIVKKRYKDDFTLTFFTLLQIPMATFDLSFSLEFVAFTL